MMDEQDISAKQATPEAELRERLMSATNFKSELEWFAMREIERMERELAELNRRLGFDFPNQMNRPCFGMIVKPDETLKEAICRWYNEFDDARKSWQRELEEAKDTRSLMEHYSEGLLQQQRAEGLKEGMTRYAWWKDGVQYVGTCGMTLEEALKDID